MEKRYLKNENLLCRDENLSLHTKRIAVVGCGGLGGYIIDQLVRLGIGYITIIDGDVFNESNLNRQLFSTIENLGNPKVKATLERIKMVNPDTNVTIHQVFVDSENAMDLLVNHDVICDALDTMSARILMQNTASELGIPVVHGAIAGWYGQVATLFPGDNIPGSLIREKLDYGLERTLGNVAFTAGLVASIQVSEVVKLLFRKGEILRNRLMIIDTLRNDFEVFPGAF